MANRSKVTAAPLRAFVAALASRSRLPRIPSELLKLSAAVARRLCLSGGEAVADDLVGELLLRLWASKGKCRDLLDLGDEALVSALHHRLRQLGCERSPRWNQLRSLRAHVRNALNAIASAHVGEPPDALHVNGHLSARLVERAVSWARDTQGLRDVRAIADLLATRYLEPIFDEMEHRADPRHFEDAHDARQLLEAVRAKVDPGAFALLASRASGVGLAKLASEQRVAVSTIHERTAVAMRCLRRAIGSNPSAGAVRLMVELIAEDARHRDAA